MTKADLIEKVYEKLGIPKKDSAELVEEVFRIMKETLASKEKIKVSRFGNFIVRDKRERIGRNPQSNEPMIISARRVLTFRPSQVLRTQLNSKHK